MIEFLYTSFVKKIVDIPLIFKWKVVTTRRTYASELPIQVWDPEVYTAILLSIGAGHSTVFIG